LERRRGGILKAAISTQSPSLCAGKPAVCNLPPTFVNPNPGTEPPSADFYDEPAVKSLGRLATGRWNEAYELVAPSSKENGDPIAYGAKVDYRSFQKELGATPAHWMLRSPNCGCTN
jgi:hypothetical protein